ncbi:MAG: recombinase family protein, partial [Lachnospiraceae bacterium]|nr:recombinase family protein [Lachnospiraceae bacterium]
DTIIFDSVSRMSRNADEGVQNYFDLYEKGIQLVFLKEKYINTEIYAENLKDKIELTGTDEDEIFKGLNNYFRKLAEKQIRIAFEQAEKEVVDLRQRTREGIETARLNGKQIGQVTGSKLHIKKEGPAKELIRKYSKDFDGILEDPECMKLVGVARNTYYKYKGQLKSTS